MMRLSDAAVNSHWETRKRILDDAGESALDPLDSLNVVPSPITVEANTVASTSRRQHRKPELDQPPQDSDSPDMLIFPTVEEAERMYGMDDSQRPRC